MNATEIHNRLEKLSWPLVQTGPRSVGSPARPKLSWASRLRGGFSLLEVVLAVGMLLASLAILSQLTTIGRTHLDKATSKAVATRLCQNKLARLLAGIEPIREVDETPLEEDPTWEYRVEVAPVELGDLVALSVSVRPAPSSAAAAQSTAARPWFTLVRWLPEDLTEANRPTGLPPKTDSRHVAELPSITKP